MYYVLCIMYYVSCIMDHGSWIMGHGSCMMYDVWCMMYYLLCFMFYALCIMYHVSCIVYRVSCIVYRVSCIVYYVLRILDLQVTSLPPCWWTITKDSSLASIVSSTNMAATSLLFDSRGIDCKSRITYYVLCIMLYIAVRNIKIVPL